MSTHRSLVKFGVTGILATLIHVLVVTTLVEILQADVGIANGLAFVAATIFSSYINTVWSFNATMTRSVVVRFWMVAVVGACLAVLIAKLFEFGGFHYLAGIAGVVLIVPPISFVLHKLWTYRDQT